MRRPDHVAGPAPESAILVATALDNPSAIALRRADAMARAVSADLHVLHVVPPARWIDALFAERSDRDAGAGSRQARADAVHRFCEVVLHRAFPRDHVVIAQGEVGRRVIEAADELDADLIVLGTASPGRDGQRPIGRVCRTVLRHARRPVLVARAPRASKAIVAATDFSDKAFPALWRASELGASLPAPVTFVHNLAWMAVLSSSGAFGMRSPPLPVSARDAARVDARLHALASGMGRGIDAVLLGRASAVDAILEIAAQQDADLVIVGAHPRGRLAALGGAGTAESVAASAGRSVLAVPIERGERRPLAWAEPRAREGTEAPRRGG